MDGHRRRVQFKVLKHRRGGRVGGQEVSSAVTMMSEGVNIS